MTCVLINYVYFSICFDYSLRQAEYVEYVQEVNGGCSPRPRFIQEPKEAYSQEDYNSITYKYDRGHLVHSGSFHSLRAGEPVPIRTTDARRSLWET